MSSCIDLRDQIDNPKVHEAYSRLVSGKIGYKAVIERKIEPPKCHSCGIVLKGDEKFCPECGVKITKQKVQTSVST